jgi:cytochrome c biogenesis protein CcdA
MNNTTILRSSFILVTVLFLTFAVTAAPAAGEEQGNEPELWFFWGEGCSLCEKAAAWLDELSGAHPLLVINRSEVWHDGREKARYRAMLEERGMRASWVPCFVLGETVWEGFNDTIAAEIRWEVEYSRVQVYGDDQPGNPFHVSDAAGRALPVSTISMGPLGTVDVQRQPLLAATLLIALVDGFNPCSLWVLTLLMAMILNTHSRLRIAAVGGTFLLVTASVYGLFIAGLFAALTVVSYLDHVRMLAALPALFFAAVNIKDYFAFGKGLSLTIPQSMKPSLYRGGRMIKKERSLPQLLAATAVFAAGAAVIELPCTAGFPAIWAGLLSQAGVAGTGFIILLAAYLAVYLAIEIVVIAAALITLRITRLQEAHGRSLKLIGGMVMAALAVVLLVNPAVLNRLEGSLYIFGGALLVSSLVMAAPRLRQWDRVSGN